MASLQFTDVQARPTEFLIGDAPTRSLTALAQRLGVSEADAATVVVRWRSQRLGSLSSRSTDVPPCAHDGTERRIVRPQDPPEQAQC